MQALSNDCLHLIFDLLQPAWSDDLTSASLVCKRWLILIHECGQYWANIRIPVPVEAVRSQRLQTPASRLALLEMASGRAKARSYPIRLTVAGGNGNPFSPKHEGAAYVKIRELLQSFESLSLLGRGFEGILDGTEPMPRLESLATEPPAPFDVARAPSLREFRGEFAPALDPAAGLPKLDRSRAWKATQVASQPCAQIAYRSVFTWKATQVAST